MVKLQNGKLANWQKWQKWQNGKRANWQTCKLATDKMVYGDWQLAKWQLTNG
jgi:hypothetical protein